MVKPNCILIRTVTLCALCAVNLGSLASAQTFNIDFGLGSGPPNSYAAAGRAGHWISVPGTHGVTVTNLVDITGQTTSASFLQIGGTQTLSFNDPALSGADTTLMNDALLTYTTVENCVFVRDLLPGRYGVLIYARMPDQPDVLAVTSVDEEPGQPDRFVGGVWPGHHEEAISFARHLGYVAASGPQAGRLGLHSGVPAGGSFLIGAALNGVQIIKLDEPDFDNNGVVDGADVDLLVAEIIAGMHNSQFDVTGDGLVTTTDLEQWLADAGRVNLSSGNAYLPGDANLDGVVDGLDFSVWNAHKFTATAAWTAGDFNADGVVDGIDFSIWNSFKFQSADGAVATVPEPSFLVLLPWLMFPTLRRHRRV